MKKHFLSGLAILLPLAIALAVIAFLINFLTHPFVEIVSDILKDLHIFSSERLTHYVSQGLILLLLFFFTVLLGAIARSFVINACLGVGDKILKKIPLFNTVYKTTRDIIRTLFDSDKNTFKQVVLVCFPHKNSYTLGLVSREAPKTCSEGTGENLISVFLPTTPNPTTGFLLMFPKQDLIFVDISAEEAIKYILSCGVITPEKRT